MKHTDAVLLDGPEDNQMYQIPVDDAGMWVGTLEHPKSWVSGRDIPSIAHEALATALESFTIYGYSLLRAVKLPQVYQVARRRRV